MKIYNIVPKMHTDTNRVENFTYDDRLEQGEELHYRAKN